MNAPANNTSMSANFRRRRIETLVSLLEQRELSGIRVLDVGGTALYWQDNLEHFPTGMIAKIDVINLPPSQQGEQHVGEIIVRYFEGDALDRSSFPAADYDLIHSNSVIEHVGNLDAQIVMAESVKALGQYHWIQTPAKSFPIEPHFMFPFFAYLPLGIRAWMLRHSKLGHHTRETDWLTSRTTCENTRLLTYQEMAQLFADSKILKERFFTLTKSYIATNL